MGQAVIHIVPATSADVDELAALEAAHQPKPWSEQVFRDELEADGRIYLLARAESILGFGGVMLAGDEAHITNLLVDPAHRSRGIGRRIMLGLIAAAIDSGTRHLTLEVRSQNDAARGLYSSLGLAPVGVRAGYYEDDDALILWVHDIDRPGFLGTLG